MYKVKLLLFLGYKWTSINPKLPKSSLAIYRGYLLHVGVIHPSIHATDGGENEPPWLAPGGSDVGYGFWAADPEDHVADPQVASGVGSHQR